MFADFESSCRCVQLFPLDGDEFIAIGDYDSIEDVKVLAGFVESSAGSPGVYAVEACRSMVCVRPMPEAGQGQAFDEEFKKRLEERVPMERPETPLLLSDEFAVHNDHLLFVLERRAAGLRELAPEVHIAPRSFRTPETWAPRAILHSRGARLVEKARQEGRCYKLDRTSKPERLWLDPFELPSEHDTWLEEHVLAAVRKSAGGATAPTITAEQYTALKQRWQLLNGRIDGMGGPTAEDMWRWERRYRELQRHFEAAAAPVARRAAFEFGLAASHADRTLTVLSPLDGGLEIVSGGGEVIFVVSRDRRQHARFRNELRGVRTLREAGIYSVLNMVSTSFVVHGTYVFALASGDSGHVAITHGFDSLYSAFHDASPSFDIVWKDVAAVLNLRSARLKSTDGKVFEATAPLDVECFADHNFMIANLLHSVNPMVPPVFAAAAPGEPAPARLDSPDSPLRERQFRPEFVLYDCVGLQLSLNAFSPQLADEAHAAELAEASQAAFERLFKRAIPRLVRFLDHAFGVLDIADAPPAPVAEADHVGDTEAARQAAHKLLARLASTAGPRDPLATSAERLALNLGNVFHRFGVNMRYLGRVYESLHNPAARQAVFHEMVCRSIKVRVRAVLAEADVRSDEVCSAVVERFTRLLFDSGGASEQMWTGVLPADMAAKYDHETLTGEPTKKRKKKKKHRKNLDVPAELAQLRDDLNTLASAQQPNMPTFSAVSARAFSIRLVRQLDLDVPIRSEHNVLAALHAAGLLRRPVAGWPGDVLPPLRRVLMVADRGDQFWHESAADGSSISCHMQIVPTSIKEAMSSAEHESVGPVASTAATERTHIDMHNRLVMDAWLRAGAKSSFESGSSTPFAPLPKVKHAALHMYEAQVVPPAQSGAASTAAMAFGDGVFSAPSSSSAPDKADSDGNDGDDEASEVAPGWSCNEDESAWPQVLSPIKAQAMGASAPPQTKAAFNKWRAILQQGQLTHGLFSPALVPILYRCLRAAFWLNSPGAMSIFSDYMATLMQSTDEHSKPTSAPAYFSRCFLGELANLWSRYDVAEGGYADFVTHFEADLRASGMSTDHPLVLHARLQYAHCLATQAKHEQAEAELTRCYELAVRLYGETDDVTTRVLRSFAHMYAQRGDLKKQRVYVAKALGAHRAQHGQGSAQYAWTASLMASVHRANGDFKKETTAIRDTLRSMAAMPSWTPGLALQQQQAYAELIRARIDDGDEAEAREVEAELLERHGDDLFERDWASYREVVPGMYLPDNVEPLQTLLPYLSVLRNVVLAVRLVKDSEALERAFRTAMRMVCTPLFDRYKQQLPTILDQLAELVATFQASGDAHKALELAKRVADVLVSRPDSGLDELVIAHARVAAVLAGELENPSASDAGGAETTEEAVHEAARRTLAIYYTRTHPGADLSNPQTAREMQRPVPDVARDARYSEDLMALYAQIARMFLLLGDSERELEVVLLLLDLFKGVFPPDSLRLLSLLLLVLKSRHMRTLLMQAHGQMMQGQQHVRLPDAVAQYLQEGMRIIERVVNSQGFGLMRNPHELQFVNQFVEFVLSLQNLVPPQLTHELLRTAVGFTVSLHGEHSREALVAWNQFDGFLQNMQVTKERVPLAEALTELTGKLYGSDSAEHAAQLTVYGSLLLDTNGPIDKAVGALTKASVLARKAMIKDKHDPGPVGTLAHLMLALAQSDPPAALKVRDEIFEALDMCFQGPHTLTTALVAMEFLGRVHMVDVSGGGNPQVVSATLTNQALDMYTKMIVGLEAATTEKMKPTLNGFDPCEALQNINGQLGNFVVHADAQATDRALDLLSRAQAIVERHAGRMSQPYCMALMFRVELLSHKKRFVEAIATTEELLEIVRTAPEFKDNDMLISGIQRDLQQLQAAAQEHHREDPGVAASA